MSQKGIKNSWRLVDFAKANGRMKVTNTLTNSETGEQFKSCAFITAGGTVTLVGFSSNLGEMSPEEIAAQKDNLQVVELESGNYKLCERGVDTWDEVDLSL